MSFTEDDIAKIPRKMESKYRINLNPIDIIPWIKNKIRDAGSFCLKLHIDSGYIFVVYVGGPKYADIQMSDYPNIEQYIMAVDAQEPIGISYGINYRGHGPRSNQFPEYNQLLGGEITDEQLQDMLNRSNLIELVIDDCEDGCGCEEEPPIEKTLIPHPDKVDWKYILDHLVFRIDYRETSHEYRTNPNNITHIDGEKLESELSLESLYLLNDIQNIFDDDDMYDIDGYDSAYKKVARRIIRIFLDTI